MMEEHRYASTFYNYQIFYDINEIYISRYHFSLNRLQFFSVSELAIFIIIAHQYFLNITIENDLLFISTTLACFS